MNKSDEAISWYKIAYDNQYGLEALEKYAFTLKMTEQYQEAMFAFKDLGLELGSPYEYKREVDACQLALKLREKPSKSYSIELADFNTRYADYAPVPYKDAQLVITSDRASSTGEETYNWTGNAFSDLFLVDKEAGTVSNLPGDINTEENEGTITFNKNYTEAYFTRCTGVNDKADAYCKIMVSKIEGDSWGLPRPLPFTKDDVNYGHPSLSEDGKRLYFSSNDPEGWGGYDIYYLERTPAGWSPPQILGRTINTIGNEKFPVVDKDTLYFSSDFHKGMGGLDIFKVYRLANGSWSSAKNLEPPINSGGDDFGLMIDYTVDPEGDLLQAGYFTSTRVEGIGGDDIYRFEKRIPPPEPEPEVVEVIEYKLLLEGYVLEKIYDEIDNPNSKVLGRKPLPGSEVEITIGNKKEKVTVGEDGLFQLELDENTDYSFIGRKEGYLNNQTTFSTRGIGQDPENPVQTFTVELELDKIYFNKEITLENIYYDFDEAIIRDDAKPTLNALAQNLKLNPQISIQMGSHTDCRGNDGYNEDLSQRRAQAAVDYLISKGISADRLSAKGYGENELAVDCICSRCTEEQHQANRRTTFAIIE
jgi:peptidoglycan-associated lipoprotein